MYLSVRTVVPLLALATALTACSGDDDLQVYAAIDCAGPATTVTPRQVMAGETVEVTGQNLWSTCPGRPGAGVDGAMQDLGVMWIQSGRTTKLATVDADLALGTALATVTIPQNATAGPARIRIGSTGSAAKITVLAEAEADR